MTSSGEAIRFMCDRRFDKEERKTGSNLFKTVELATYEESESEEVMLDLMF